MRIKPCRLFLLLILLAVPAYADPVTITFNPGPNQEYFTPYTEQGFNFCCNVRLTRFHLPSEPTNYIIENYSSHSTLPNTIRIDYGGGTFDFLGADLRFNYGTNVFRASNGAQLTFGSNLGFVEAQLTGITWLEWVHYGCDGDPGPCPAGMDNFRFNTHPETVPTPEPATVLLLGSGLLGALRVARRKRRG
jgi:hypothetical protein